MGKLYFYSIEICHENFSMLKWLRNNPESSSGRTEDSGSFNGGSNPSSGE